VIKASYYVVEEGRGDGSYNVRQTSKGVVVELHPPHRECSRLKLGGVRVDNDTLELSFDCVGGVRIPRVVVKLLNKFRGLRISFRTSGGVWSIHVRLR